MSLGHYATKKQQRIDRRRKRVCASVNDPGVGGKGQPVISADGVKSCPGFVYCPRYLSRLY